jgi:hypothetical protein
MKLNPHAVCVLVLIILTTGKCLAQDTTAQRREELPKLEIPEITIVGKKAITLPFARKGEIYDVNVYDPPPPDTSLLAEGPVIPLPIGALPRVEAPEIPWRLAMDGGFGSFATGTAHGYFDYRTRRWGLGVTGGYRTTNGHTANASGNGTDFGVSGYSLITTDNDFLGTFRAATGINYTSEEYGLFGIPDPRIDRSRRGADLYGRIESLNRRGGSLRLALSSNFWDVTDRNAGSAIDSNVSVVSPKLAAGFGIDVNNNLRFNTGLEFSSISLDYPGLTQSPSLVGFSGSVRMRLDGGWSATVGGMVSRGTDQTTATTTLAAPLAQLDWRIDTSREVSFWYQPSLKLATYDEHIRRNPYLIRDIALRPERTAIDLGGSFRHNVGAFAVELRGSFAKTGDRSITLADSLGRLSLGYVDADQTTLDAQGTLAPIDRARLKFGATIQRAVHDGTQLPMVPLVLVTGRGELDLVREVMLWSSLEFQSKRNVDLAGDRSLEPVYLIGAGASARIIPRVVVSFEVANLLDTKYEWWSAYRAPGIQFGLEAKVNLR